MLLPSRRIALGIALLLILLASAWFTSFYLFKRIDRRKEWTYSAAKRAFQRGDHTEALSICRELLKSQKNTPQVLLMAGESASRLMQYEEAIKLYDSIPDSATSDAAIARWAAGEITLQMGRMSETIERMEQSLILNPTNDKPRIRLIYLLNLSGRRWDAFPHLFELVRQDRWTVQHLLYLGNIAKPVENEKELNGFLMSSPDDSLPLLGLARIRLREGDTSGAKKRLTQLLERFPHLVEAHVQMGKLLQQIAPEQIAAWNASLPKNAENHPEVWMIRGEWARDQGKQEEATRCFAESIRLDPDHLAAITSLIQSLSILGETDRSNGLTQRATQLEKLSFVFERIMANEWTMHEAFSRNGPSKADLDRTMRSKEYFDPIVLAAQQTFDLGRYWESEAWCKYGLSFDPSHSTLNRIAEAVRQSLKSNTPRTSLKSELIDTRWVQSLKYPDWKKSPDGQSSFVANLEPESQTIRFTELENALQFTYYSSRTTFADGRRMFEFTGGGVGVLDYDRDGWPDLFLSQGSNWPSDSDPRYSDRLKRNLGAGKSSRENFFQDVTEWAGVIDHAFSQGVSIGDIDSDGFDDIYICNFGVNQLWLNQGDGTFRDGATSIEPLPGQWTVSAAMVDVNNDGLAEIYDANYVEGDDVATRRCAMRNLPRACSPLNFPPARGRLLAVDNEGTFREVPSSLFPESLKTGNALGLAVFRIQNQSLPSIFIANDQVANSMLVATPDENSALGIRFTDTALMSGLAYDGEGRAQACMGVATSDINQDGTLDLLVTNYYDETNTLYLQESNGVFRDATRSSGLIAPSLKMLGFGAQFMDAQCDGVADLVVLNGHIDDMSHAGMPFRMRSQFFLGDGKAKFVEQKADVVGAYFATERLGRALALIDFNRDGRQDFVATDLERPSSLVRNDSYPGNYLTVHLVGTKSHRDAVGTIVVASAGKTQWTQQLVGGNGYMVTNEKRIHFGLGSAKRVDRIELQWPSGKRETYVDLPANTSWLAIEDGSLFPRL